MDGRRRCKECGLEKDVASFYNVAYGDGKERRCKECHDGAVVARRRADVTTARSEGRVSDYALYHREYRRRARHRKGVRRATYRREVNVYSERNRVRDC